MKYPTINYIGNKDKVSSWIVDNLPVNSGKVLDLFCGGCSVSYEMKKRGYTVYSNDILYSNYIIAKAIIENNETKFVFNNNIDTYFNNKIFNNISWLINKLYFEYEVKELARLINYSNTLSGYQKYIFLSLLRRAMIRKLPYSRMNIKWAEIVKLRDEEYSYEKYKRRRAYHNQSFSYHIHKNNKEYNDAIFDNFKENKAFNSDAIALLENINEELEVIYIDPPYPNTMNNYTDFYGAFDKMLNHNIMENVDYRNKENFLKNIKQLIIKAKKISKFVVISLNNKCVPTVSEVNDIIKPFVKSINILEKEHIYKVTGKENKNSTYEILMIIKF